MDPKSPEFMKTMLDLRARALAENQHQESQLKNALDQQYWRKLNPDMAICGEKSAVPATIPAVDPSVVEKPLRMLFTSGYFELPAIVSGPTLEHMRRCFDVIREEGWPTGFVFIYDEFWRAFRGSVLARFLTGALGEGYRQLPYIWGHYVPPNSHGWRPHVDGPPFLGKLTVWLALTDATLENGCMYVLPRNSQTEKFTDHSLETESSERADALSLLQHSRALPAVAGSCLGWGPNVIHWGSVSGPSAPARLSISVEFASRDMNPPDEGLTILDADPAAPLPTFETRLHLIASEIKHYEGHFEAGLLASQSLAREILQRTHVESATPSA
jgi:hypothetical protein